MARKKAESQLQREIETQEEWEEVMAMEGLWVVDVYQDWCGPCQALVGNFRRLKNELGDSLLNFAIAKADTIDALEVYRGRCEPTFLFYAGGILVSFIHGANAPKVQRVITEQLAQEHKVLEGQGERKEVKDTVITRAMEKAIEKQEEEEAAREAEGLPPKRKDDAQAADKEALAQLHPSEDHDQFSDSEDETGLESQPEAKGVTVAIIKPDAVAAGKTEEILAEMVNAGIDIIAQEERELTEEEAREIYSELENEDYFDDLIKFMTSGPSHVLVLTRGETGETIIKDWREMLGPTIVEHAKDEAPESLRARYGEGTYMNALHGSSSEEQAAKELAFFFPNLAIPTYLKKKENIQRTLALIRPEAFAQRKDEILEKIQQAGFSIALYKEVQLTKEQSAEFYKEHEGNAYYDELVNLMASGPLLALCLARDEAIEGWRGMLGPNNIDEAIEQQPNSLRAKFTGESGINQFHGSDSEDAAKKEIEFFFPMEQTVAVIKPNAIGTKDEIIDKIHEAGFRIAAQKETTITKDIVDILYPHHQEADYYEDMVNSLTSGPTMFMVLSKENAVEGWRKAIGDTDPQAAKTKNPDSLRAQYGEDIINNAVHGSSNKQRAKEEMRAVFGDLDFNEDGSIKGQTPQLDEAKVEKTDDTTLETTADQSTLDQDTTQEPSADVTADTTQANETQAETAAGDQTADETTVADSTMDETTEGETTMDETTVGNTTVTETNKGDETVEPSGDQTADQTTADQTTADQTTADQTTADQTTADTTAADTTTADNTAGQTATTEEGQAQQQEQEAKPEQPQEEQQSSPAQEESKPAADESKPEETQKTEEATPAAEQTQAKTEGGETPGQEANSAEAGAAEEKPAASEGSAKAEGSEKAA